MKTHTKTLLAACAACAASALAGSAHSATITVLNPSFESDNIGNNIADSVIAIPGWTRVSGSAFVWLADRNSPGTLTGQTKLFSPTPDTDGEQYLLTQDVSGAYQVTSYDFVAGETYTLTIDIGKQENQAFATTTINLGTGSTFGTNLLTTNVLQNTTPTPSLDGGGQAQNSWETWVIEFTAGAGVVGQDLRIDLSSAGSGRVAFDNVRLEAVPEPSSALLLGLGGLLIARRRRG